MLLERLNDEDCILIQTRVLTLQGEQLEQLGQLSSVTIPMLVVLGALVGLFAAQTYNQDASVFLDSPKSSEDSARLYTFE